VLATRAPPHICGPTAGRSSACGGTSPSGRQWIASQAKYAKLAIEDTSSFVGRGAHRRGRLHPPLRGVRHAAGWSGTKPFRMDRARVTTHSAVFWMAASGPS
jgi:hypothetical protein